jgi:pimeloyl-ACP methyl ester carboxylesterase
VSGARLLGVIGALSLVLGGCSGTPERAVDRLPLSDCVIGGVSARCGTLDVPENRASGEGRRISLRIAVLPATARVVEPDPVFSLAGGPGDAATDDADQARATLPEVNLHRDIVLVDQRGTGGSNDLRCPTVDDSSQWAADARSCWAGLDGDPRAYTTAWAVDDLDDVRAALGYDRINLYGGSYGATAAQVYLLRHGDHARSAILMSGSLLDFPIFEQFPASSQDALDLVFARCSADPACAAAYPDPAGDLTAITARLDAGPVTLTDPATGRSGQMTRDDLATGIHELLLDTSTAAVLPRLLHSAAAGNWADALAAQPGAEPEESDGPSGLQVMNLTIMCWEPWASLRRAQTDAAAEGSYLRYPDVRAMTLPEDVCAVVPRPPAEAMYGPVTPVDVPVLLMNGAADPQDPPANVAGAREAFPDSVSLTVPNQGHHFAITACQAGILAAFVDRASTTGWSSECLRDTPAPPFDLG